MGINLTGDQVMAGEAVESRETEEEGGGVY